MARATLTLTTLPPETHPFLANLGAQVRNKETENFAFYHATRHYGQLSWGA